MLKRSGFSLVELSIVLVILGLLTGGILSGQALIRAAELRSVSEEFKRYQSAVYTFRSKYMGLPGDLANATAFWGAQDVDAATCQTTSSNSPLTCNGNGDGSVNWSSSVVTSEAFRFWQHLASAGLIEGNYTGVNGASAGSTYDHDIAINCPRSRLSTAGWGARTLGVVPPGSMYYGLDYGNEFFFGSEGTQMPIGAALRPEEAWNIDTKIDDGRPGYGKLIAYRINTCTDAASGSDLESDYLLTSSAIACGLRFINAF